VQPRGAGPQEDADAPCAVGFARRGDARDEAVLLKAQLRQSVVAAIEVAKVFPYPITIQSLDRPDAGLEAGRLEIPGNES